jgi:hypothetical protein
MLLIIAHSPSRTLEEGFLPAAQGLGVSVCILTDCLYEHLVRAQKNPIYTGCQLLECDAANPLAIVKALAIHQLKISAVIALDAGLHSCATVVAEQAGLTQAGAWQSALLCEQAGVSGACQGMGNWRWLINAAHPLVEQTIPSQAYPVSARPLQSGGLHSEKCLVNAAALEQYLNSVGGYLLVETMPRSGELYALDLLHSSQGFQILCGSHFHDYGTDSAGKRARSFIRRPPFCEQVIAQLAQLQPGYGRYCVEYRLVAGEPQIRDINNGNYDGDTELALAALLDGNLFRAQLQLSLGQEPEALSQRFVGEFEWLPDTGETSQSIDVGLPLEQGYRRIYRPATTSSAGWLLVCGPDQQQAQALFYATRAHLQQRGASALSTAEPEVMA